MRMLRMASLALALCVLPSCQLIVDTAGLRGDDSPADAGPGDGLPPPDATVLSRCPDTGHPTTLFSLADVPAAIGSVNLTIGEYTIDTSSTGPLRDFRGQVVDAVVVAEIAAVGGDALALVASSFVFNGGARLRATGSRPLMLIAANTVQMNDGSVIDVSSTSGQDGAGAGTGCEEDEIGDEGAPVALDAGGGGGGGGSTPGGFGGSSIVTTNDGGGEVTTPMNRVRGGCRGGRGAGLRGGVGGSGGGAVVVFSCGRLDITGGQILAGGAGGSGGGDGSGGPGGGGGAGGYILLDAESGDISGGAGLFANGGGGGGGGIEAGSGSDGPAADDSARGGDNAGAGGNGGSGGFRNDSGDVGANGSGGGGGGGGGGAGRILIGQGLTVSPGLDAQISPVQNL